MFFMMLFTESTLSRLRRGDGAGSSSGLKEVVELEGLPVSGGRIAGEGDGEANGDLIVFTRLFTLSRFREGESECSDAGGSWVFESEENGEKTGERNGEGRGMDIPWARYVEKGGREVREVSVVFMYLPPETSTPNIPISPKTRKRHAATARQRSNSQYPPLPYRLHVGDSSSITGTVPDPSAKAPRSCCGKSGIVLLPGRDSP